ncbi:MULTISPECIES: GTP 3',8-cyclase MoaA [Geobacillus]|jgi:GTP 3',8-cyclase|uniref:GTP 3',8-cyclase n=2 Tax=Geobacillus thermodenitrificans TaxID=33940 RepID=A4IL35_GEOTN|nr:MULTISPECIES: GTP 3',8-cyclase MoaA [Geobacillus]ABO66039.1 Molybdenum cofactor biosynthesis protein A [Geobacillus thermodenitrificans NG80-2]ARP41772.1 Cyclic pyranopterin monophosphate synthase [Geobacillus thermodenitrificans]ATO36850.1 cyclic pyranopterin phosphate synthase [Geobacillus thermodenitrificans]MEC5188963.1 cyclic pyranopterin phosphate synthase [Geobacillus thermodenitrificans]MED3906370.1 GTP 3',8-cyclase MoaA [Geobacillus thermodenitrificans]
MSERNRTDVMDRLSRPLRDLRLSVIDQCNFRCIYCMPAEVFGPNFRFLAEGELLTVEEMALLSECFVELGVEKIRLTGGEPLLRRDLDALVARLSAIPGLRDIGLTTNGVHLVKWAQRLKEAGLKRVNVSLDALDDDIFRKMNGIGVGVAPVLKGIEAARAAGLGVKVNMVVKKGWNDSQIVPMASYFKDLGIPLRLIEFMDVGTTNGWDYSHVVTKKEMYEQINAMHPLEPIEKAYFGEVASRYRYVGTEVEVGFIASVTETFCRSCTRARISADGKLYTCLFASKGVSLKDKLRAGATKEELKSLITAVWNQRTDRYSEERTEETAKQRVKIEMSYIGG